MGLQRRQTCGLRPKSPKGQLLVTFKSLKSDNFQIPLFGSPFGGRWIGFALGVGLGQFFAGSISDHAANALLNPMFGSPWSSCAGMPAEVAERFPSSLSVGFVRRSYWEVGGIRLETSSRFVGSKRPILGLDLLVYAWQRSVRFVRIRDFKQHYFNGVPPNLSRLQLSRQLPEPSFSWSAIRCPSWHRQNETVGGTFGFWIRRMIWYVSASEETSKTAAFGSLGAET